MNQIGRAMTSQAVNDRAPDCSSYTVLIIEDNPVLQQQYRDYLASDHHCHYSVVEVESAATAITLCQNTQVDVILASDHLLDAVGLEFLKALNRQFGKSTPPVLIITREFVTTSSVAVLIQRAVQAIKLGAEDFLISQSLSAEQLQKSVWSAIEHQQVRSELQQFSEQELLDRVAELETLIEIAPVGIAIASDPICAHMQCNAYMRELLGVQLGHNISKTAPVEDRPAFRVFQDGQEVPAEELPMQRSARLGIAVRDTEIEIRLPDGTERQLLSYATPLRDRDNGIRGSVGAFLEITERKQMEAELRSQETTIRRQLVELEGIYATAPVGLSFHDTDSRFVRINDRLAAMNGTPAAEHIGRTLREVLPELADTLEPIHRQVIQTGEPILNIEIHGTTQSQPGVLRDWTASYYPLKSADGAVLGVNVVVQDITDIKQAQAEREQLLRERADLLAIAEQANRSKDEFVTIVAHELRSPLNAIAGWAKLLQTRQFDHDTTQKALDTILRNTQAQMQLVEDLLDVSRMERGTLQLTMTPVRLHELVAAAVETVQPTAEAKAVQLNVHLQTVEPMMADFQRLHQVVLNLLTNAIKFTPAGQQIEISLRQEVIYHRAYAQLQVRDTGKGIHPDFLPYIFERFQQDHQTAKTSQGLGLGLAIVKYLTEMHQGTVTATSPGEGQGATFTIQLPLHASTN